MPADPVCLRIVSVREDKDQPGRVGELLGEFTTLKDGKPYTEIVSVHPGVLSRAQCEALWALYMMRRFKTYLAEVQFANEDNEPLSKPLFRRWRKAKDIESYAA